MRNLIALLRQIKPIGAGFLLCLLILWLQPYSASDQKISDRLLTSQYIEADDDYLVIEINGADLREYGRPILSRENMTQLLSVIENGKPERLLFDFSAGEVVSDEAQLARAAVFERFGRDRLGVVTALGVDDEPHARYAAASTLLDGRLTPDVDGWHRRVGRSEPEHDRGNNPAIWLATGELNPASAPIDLRIAHEEFEVFSASDVLEGRVTVADRKVILSAGPDVAHTRAGMPHAGPSSRAKVIAAAAQSVEQEFRQAWTIGQIINANLVILGSLLSGISAMVASSARRLIGMGVATISVLAACSVLLALWTGSPITLVTTITCCIIMINTVLFYRLRIGPLVRNFLRGDLSPEEAWAWRVCEQSPIPAMMFTVDKRVKRSNAGAKDLVEKYEAEIGALALPQPGEWANQIEFQSTTGLSLCFEVEWPFENLPIARLRDVSAARSTQRDLVAQLNRDELTGALNRRGLNEKLAKLTQRRAEYSVFYIDLNGFKQVNDTYGHDVGDELLIKAAEALRDATRGDSAVARLGGDEFAVLVDASNTSEQNEKLAQRLAEALDISIHLDSVGRDARVAGAVGYGTPRYQGESADDVLRRADQMMYRRKSEMKQGSQAA